jgi:hypothetical protein
MISPNAGLVALSAVAVPESVTLKVRLDVPTQEAVGAPEVVPAEEITPAEFIVRQAGRVPLDKVHE